MTQLGPGDERARCSSGRSSSMPSYSPAWAGLATVHATLYEWFGAKAEDLARAERASRRGAGTGARTGRCPRRTRLRAVAVAAVRRGGAGIRGGDPPQSAISSMRTTTTREPASRAATSRARRISFGKAADVRQEDFQSPMLLAQSLRMLGQHDESAGRAAARVSGEPNSMLALNPLDGRALSLGSGRLFDAGQTGARDRVVATRARALSGRPEHADQRRVPARARRARRRRPCDFLERVFARGWGKRDWIEHDPDYDILRDDPRFVRLVAKLK